MTDTPVRYEQELSRSLGIWGNVAITISAVTPASSVFIIVPLIVVSVGTGSFLAMAFAGLIGVVMAFCWAELSAAFPIVGGDYALVRHAFKGRAQAIAGAVSFVTFSLYIALIAFIPAVIALGTADYLRVIWEVDTEVAAAVVMVAAAAIAIVNIRLNAFVTGIFLAIELLALLVVTVLGIVNWERSPVDLVTDPVVGSGLDPVSFSLVLSLTAVAVFAYNGYSGAVFFAEETRGGSERIARAILLSLVITVAAELIPLTAVLIGSPSLEELTAGDQAPMTYFLLATSSDTVNTLVSLGIAIAIINAVIAIVLEFGRVLFSSGRDRAWPGPVSRVLCAVHPRLQTPWLATALIGMVGAVLVLTVSLDTLATLTGASLVADYAIVAVAALVGRASGATAHSPYRMPWWPVPPVLALGALVYVTTEQATKYVVATGVTMAIGLVYYLVYLHPRRDSAWQMRLPVLDAPNDPVAPTPEPVEVR